MSNAEDGGGAPYWTLDSPVILDVNGQRLTRGGSVTKYMRSGSARRRQVKEKNCIFCDYDIEGDELDEHLKLSERCRILYSRKLRVKMTDKVDPIMTRLYSCINCHLTRRIILSKHLNQNRSCLVKYRERFKLNDVVDICKKVSELKRVSILSRQKLSRSLETAKKAKEQVAKNLTKTVVSSLNEYRASVELANYRFCDICSSNFNDSSARMIKPDEEIFEDLIESKQKLRRFGNFWICNSCSDESNGRKVSNVEPSVELNHVVRNNNVITFFPWKSKTEESKIIHEMEIRVFFPKTYSALDGFEKAEQLKSQRQMISRMFEARSLDELDISAMWENEMKKYRDVEKCATRYTGVIKDGSKKLTNVQKVVDDSAIAGSSNWFYRQLTAMGFRIDQFGPLCFLVKIEVPKINIETLATSMITEGFVVTIEKLGLASGEFTIKYILHLDHMSDTDCAENCGNKIDLKEYCESGEFDLASLGNKHLSTYVSSVHQKLNSFVKSIVKSPNCELFSTNYHFMITFDVSGNASFVGLIWPVKLDEVNVEVASKEEISDEKMLTSFIDGAISASSDARVLRSTFKISEMEAEDLVQKARDHQIHLCSSAECQRCRNPEVPSLVTLLKMCPDSNENLKTAKRMKLFFLEELRNLSVEHKQGLSSFDWLESIWDRDNVSGDISEDLKYLRMRMDDEEYEFVLDERLSSLLEEFDPFLAVYHYSIACCDHEEQFNVALKRLRLLDCFTVPYNNIYLKAANSSVFVMPVRGSEAWERMISSSKESEDPEDTEVDMASSVIWTHRKISLAEAISLFDTRKKRIVTSTSTEFVNARQQRRVVFKKLNEANNESFKIDKTNDHFELVKTNISRHFHRVNGKSLLLAEFCSWYDFVGCQKSEELSKIYQEAGCDVPSSTVECVSSPSDETHYLPEYLLLTNGDVMKKRPRQKVLTYPRFPKCSYEHSYSNLLLFYPLGSEEDLLSGNIRDLLSQTNDDDENVVEVNQRYVYK